VRNSGEDLLEDMLALDKLSGLFPEDRATRKAAIAKLDSLLEQVDQTKADLARLQKEVEARVASFDAAETEVRKQSWPSPRSEKRLPSPRASSTWMPDQHFWTSLELPVRFVSRELSDAYEIVAKIPGIHANDVDMALREDGSLLHISGHRLPTTAECENAAACRSTPPRCITC